MHLYLLDSSDSFQPLHVSKSPISSLVAKFACFNLATNFSTVVLLDYFAVIYLLL